MARARRNWTLEEDARLRRVINNALAQSRPLLWRELAKSVPGRSNKDCRRRWWNSLADATAKGSWSEEEDERLIEAVGRHGTSWSQVARDVGSRNSDQCSSHWSQVLDPDINYCDWTSKEDEHLLHAVLSHGTNWTTIVSLHVPKRTTLALKNRYSTLRMRHENGNKSREQSSRKKQGSSRSSTEDTITPSQNQMHKNQMIQQYLRESANEGIEGIEEDEDEDGDDGEGEDGEEANGDVDENDDDGNVSSIQFLANSIKANTATICSHAEASNITPSGALAGFAGQSGSSPPSFFPHGTSPISTENWTNDMVDHAPYDSPFSLKQPSLYLEPGGDFFGAIQGPSRMSTGESHTTLDAMDLISSPTPDQPTLSNPGLVPSTSSNLVGTEANPLQASECISTNPTAQGHPSTTFQVSINMVCTGAQLQAIMVNMAGAGCVTMKIEPKL